MYRSKNSLLRRTFENIFFLMN